MIAHDCEAIVILSGSEESYAKRCYHHTISGESASGGTYGAVAMTSHRRYGEKSRLMAVPLA